MKNEIHVNLSDKLISVLGALASGVVTDLFCNDILVEHFSGQISNGQITIEKFSEFNLASRYITLVVVFVLLWFLFCCIAPLAFRAFESLHGKNMPVFSKKQVLEVYRKAKETIEQLYFKVVYSKNSNVSYNVIIFVELCSTIADLTKVFDSEKEENTKTIADLFRKGATLYDLRNKISKHEYQSLLNMADSLLEQIYREIPKEYNYTLESDYLLVKAMLKKLKSSADAVW